VQEIVDDVMAASFAVWQSKTVLARSCEAGKSSWFENQEHQLKGESFRFSATAED
jgi:hypothetical protein